MIERKVKMSELEKVKLGYEDTKPKQQKANKPKEKTVKKTTTPAPEKTIKVKTLIIAIAVIIGFIASFIGGIVTANGYNDKVTNDAKALAETLKPQTK